MSIAEYESSTDRGQPVELYLFVYGTNEGRHYAYTNAEQAVVLDLIEYTPLPIDRDKIKTKGRAEGQEVSIQVPRSSAVSQLFRVFPPSRVVTVVIRQGHLAEQDDGLAYVTGDQFPVIWSGRVLERSLKGSTCHFNCESSEAGMRRPGLRRNYQWACPLALYGTRCGASKSAAEHEVTVGAVAGNKLTLTSGWNGTYAVGAFLGGLVEWESLDGREYRTIIGVSGDTLTLNAAPGELAATDTAFAYLGCPHTLEGCETLHGRIVSYGGQPFIPLVNPVGKNNHT